MRDLTSAERKVVARLGEAYNEFGRLPEGHLADRGDFVNAIHAAQNIVLARPGAEVLAGQREENHATSAS